jgi:acylphosphatase
VQGVYYRASARHEGERLGLSGWVRNRDDGGVDLHLQGEAAVVDAMLGWCRVGPPAARVSRVEVGDAEPDRSLFDFEVR